MCRFRLITLSLAMTGVVLTSRGHGAKPDPAEDRALTLAAKEVLRDDPRLRSSGIGVDVRGGVVVLWGSVADPALSAVAREVIDEWIRGLRQRDPKTAAREVRDETFVVKPDRLVERIKELMQQGGDPRRDPEPLVMMPSPPRPRRVEATPAAGTARLFAPRGSSGPQEPPSLAHAPTGPPADYVADPRPPADPRVAATPVSARSPVLGLYAKLEELRDQERRFIGVRIDLRDGVVRLSGQVRRESDIWDLAERFSEVPGVKRVVVGELSTH